MIIYNDKGKKLLEIEVDDNSYRHRVIMCEHSLTLYYSLPEHVELPVGSYCEFQGETFTLERPEAFKMKHSRYFEYTVTMEAPEAKAKIWKFRNTVDGRLKFSLTAKPVEHLQMFVDNMNRRDKGWTVGDCIDGVEQCINYDHAFCLDALKQQASEFKTEYEFKGKRVSLKKVEYNKTYPLPLSYGRGNGFKSGVGRTNTGEQPPVEILYVQGGTDNLDPSKYGASELRLPKSQQLGFDGEYFETEDGFNKDSSRLYITDEDGLSIRRYDKQLASLAAHALKGRLGVHGVSHLRGHHLCRRSSCVPRRESAHNTQVRSYHVGNSKRGMGVQHQRPAYCFVRCTRCCALHLEAPLLAVHRRVLRDTQHRNNIIYLNL